MLEKAAANPTLLRELLTTSVRVMDYSGQFTEGPAFQMALGACDVDTGPEQNDGMVEMIESYLLKLPDGNALKLKQTIAQFPDDWEKKAAERNQLDIEALETVVKAISDAEQGDSCEAALNEFRDHLKPRGVIKSGFHFNDQLLLKAFELYDDEKEYKKRGGYGSHKNNLLWQKVIGHIQRFSPACLAQAFCQGVFYIVHAKEKLNRSFEFRHNKGVHFHPLNRVPSYRLGHDFAAFGGDAAARVALPAGWRTLLVLVSGKNKSIAKLMPRPGTYTHSICGVIM